MESRDVSSEVASSGSQSDETETGGVSGVSGQQSSHPNGGASATSAPSGVISANEGSDTSEHGAVGTTPQPNSGDSNASTPSNTPASGLASTDSAETGSTEGDAEPTGPNVVVTRPNSVEEFWKAWAEVVCVYGERCNGFTQLQTCQEYVLDNAGSSVRFASPLLSLDLEAAFECLEAYAGPSCPPDNDLYNEGLGEVCPRFLIGTQATTGPCQEDVECVGGNYCNTDDSCPGDCRPLAGLDQDCSDRPCALGLSCGAGAVCVHDLVEGATCDDSERAFIASCGLNTTCRGGECVAVRSYVRETNDTCWREDECKGGARCVDGTCEGLGQVGQSCDTWYCAPGLFCDAVTTSCQPEKQPGDPCTQETECSGSECSYGFCKARSGIGESCTGDVWCYSGECVDQRCELSRKCD